MLRSSHRGHRTKAMAELLAMIASARPFTPHRTDTAACAEESLYESATDFCAALELYAARPAFARAAQMRKLNH